MLNKSGPSLDPWVTPAIIGNSSEDWPSNIVLAFLSVRYDHRSFIVVPLICICLSLDSRPLCHTQSKAALISRNTEWTVMPLVHASLIFVVQV